MSKSIPTCPTVASFLGSSIEASEKTQLQIAQECGFDNPNILTMFKQGRTKLPIGRVGAIAKALDVDPAHLLRLVLLEYVPDTWEAIETVIHSTLLTANERELVNTYRTATAHTDPKGRVVVGDAGLTIVSV